MKEVYTYIEVMIDDLEKKRTSPNRDLWFRTKETVRAKAHLAMCEVLGIDHEKSKVVTANLDKVLALYGMEMPEVGNKLGIRNAAEVFLDYVLDKKAKGTLYQIPK